MAEYNKLLLSARNKWIANVIAFNHRVVALWYAPGSIHIFTTGLGDLSKEFEGGPRKLISASSGTRAGAPVVHHGGAGRSPFP